MVLNMATERELTLVEVAASLRVGIDAARDLLQSGEIPSRKQGRSWRVLDSDVEAYKQKQREKRTKKPEGEA